LYYKCFKCKALFEPQPYDPTDTKVTPGNGIEGPGFGGWEPQFDLSEIYEEEE
jgi:hypothetical protein